MRYDRTTAARLRRGRRLGEGETERDRKRRRALRLSESDAKALGEIFFRIIFLASDSLCFRRMRTRRNAARALRRLF